MRVTKTFLFLLFFAAFTHAGFAQGLESHGEKMNVVKSINVFPNPASEYVHIRLDDLKASQVKLTMHNIIGNEVQIEPETVDQHEIRIKIKDLASGYYLLALRDEQTRFRGTYKFLKR
jgi:hypothetical protein